MPKIKTILSILLLLVSVIGVPYFSLNSPDSDDMREIDVSENTIAYCSKQTPDDATLQAICIEKQNEAFNRFVDLSISMKTLSLKESEQFKDIMQTCIINEQEQTDGVINNWVGVCECYDLAARKEEAPQ